MRKFWYTITLILVSFLNGFVDAQSVLQIEKRANEAFENKQYDLARTDFQQLLARDPISIDYNFKYAVCLYFSNDRVQSKKYFTFIATQSNPPCENAFYLGKIYQYEYNFDRAIQWYKSYQTCAPEKGAIPVVNEISNCESGKALLKKPKALSVVTKTSTLKDLFYKNYNYDLIGGGSFQDLELQSKLDKKKGYIPHYYFKKGEKIKVFASHNETTGKLELQFITKISQDTWSKPILIKGLTEEKADKCFPYFDVVSKTLYFSSNGFNAMGGFDLFKTDFDPENNTIGEVTNLDFPFSSVEDDFYFIPLDSLNQMATFATTRNSALGKIEIYEVKLEEFADQIIYLKGQIQDQVDVQNKTAQITVVDETDGKVYGPFPTDNQGNYNVILPGSGNYRFMVKVDGTDKTFENKKFIPKQHVNQTFSQNITYLMQDGIEKAEFSYEFNVQEMDALAFKMGTVSSMSVSPRLSIPNNNVIASNNEKDQQTTKSTQNETKESIENWLVKLSFPDSSFNGSSKAIADALLDYSSKLDDLNYDAKNLNKEIKTQEAQKKTISSKLNSLVGQSKIEKDPFKKKVLLEKLNPLMDSLVQVEIQQQANQLILENINQSIAALKNSNETIKAESLSDRINLFLLKVQKDSLVTLLSSNQAWIEKIVLNQKKSNSGDQIENLLAQQKERNQALEDLESELVASIKEFESNQEKIVNQSNSSSPNSDATLIKKDELTQQQQILKTKIEQQTKNYNALKHEIQFNNQVIEMTKNKDVSLEMSGDFLNASFKESKLDGNLAEDQVSLTLQEMELSQYSMEKVKKQPKTIQNMQGQKAILEQELVLLNQSLSNLNDEELEAAQLEIYRIESSIQNVNDEITAESQTSNNAPNKSDLIVKNPEGTNENPNDSKAGTSNTQESEASNQESSTSNQENTNENKESINNVESKTENSSEIKEESNREITQTKSTQVNGSVQDENQTKANEKSISSEYNPNAALNNVEESLTETTQSNSLIDPNIAFENSPNQTMVPNKTITDKDNISENNTNLSNAKNEIESNNPKIELPNNADSKINDNQELTIKSVEPSTNIPLEKDAKKNESTITETQNNAAENQTRNQESVSNNGTKETETEIETETETNTANVQLRSTNEATITESQNNASENQTRNQEIVSNNETEKTETEIETETNTANVQLRSTNEATITESQNNASENQTRNQEIESNIVAEETETVNNSANVPVNPSKELNTNFTENTEVTKTPSNNAIKTTNQSSTNETDKKTVILETVFISDEEQKQLLAQTNSGSSTVKNQSVEQILKQQKFLNHLTNTEEQIGGEAFEKLFTKEEISQLAKAHQRDIQNIKNVNATQNTENQSYNPNEIDFNASNTSSNQWQNPPKFTETLPSDVEIQQYLASSAYDRYITERKNLTKKWDDVQIVNQQIHSLKGQWIQIATLNPVESENILKELLIKIKEKENKESAYQKQLTQVIQTQNAEKFNAMIAQGILPKNQDVIASSQKYNKDNVAFSINDDAAVLPGDIPFLSSIPKGLVFTVQVGAFRKPVPSKAFSKLNPVNAERLNNGLVCIIAGFFENSQSANMSRKLIRGNGFSDAFLVSYCDGMRIPLYQALEMERNGGCNTRNKDELLTEVASIMNSAKNEENIAAINEEVFITVQVAALKATTSESKFKGIADLFYTTSKSGLVKYSSGKFLDLNAANERKKEARQLGFSDAYLVAYQGGKPISIKEASEIISKQQAYQKKNNEKMAPVNQDLSDVIPEPPKPTYIYFTKPSEVPDRTVLSSINETNNFSYQTQKNHFSSGPYDSKAISPLTWLNFADYTSESVNDITNAILIDIESQNVSLSLLHDYLMKQDLSFCFIQIGDKIKCRISPNNDDKDKLNRYLDNLGLNYISQ